MLASLPVHPADVALAVALCACRLLAPPLGFVWLQRLHYRGAAVLAMLRRCPGGAGHALRSIALARLSRTALKLALFVGGQAAVLRLVRCHGVERLPAGGCVLALSHSPWARVMAYWTRTRDFALIFAHPRWAYWGGRCTSPQPGSDFGAL